MLGRPGGVFSVNDGMPTQIPLPTGRRQPCDSIGIIEGAFITHLMRF